MDAVLPKFLACKICGAEKPIALFPKNANRKYGVLTQCKDCYNERRRPAFEKLRKDPEYLRKTSAKVMAKYNSDPEYRERMKAQMRERAKNKWHNDPAYREKQRVAVAEYVRKRVKVDPEFAERFYIAKKLRNLRKPKWADDSAIAAIYREARRLRRLGNAVEVDHIIPLRGDLVSGLHVAANLEIVTRHANAVKSNHYVVE